MSSYRAKGLKRFEITNRIASYALTLRGTFAVESQRRKKKLVTGRKKEKE